MTSQKLTKPEFTTCEKKLLCALEKLEVPASITQICELAEVSRIVYYDGIKKEHFKAAWDEISKSYVRQGVPGIIQKMMKQALEGSLQHQERVLEMANVLGVQNNSINVNIGLSPKEEEEARELANDQAQHIIDTLDFSITNIKVKRYLMDKFL